MDLETQKTIASVAVCGALAVAIMLLRLVMRRIREQDFNLSDYLTMCAIVLFLARSALTPIVLLWQNNNISPAYRATHIFTPDEIYRREVGSKLTLANRAVYNTYLWVQKGVVLLLYKRMLADLPRPEQIMKGYWVVLFLTFIAIQVATFTECSPVDLYWQVVPDPGKCPFATNQLIVLVAMNVFTDLILIILPMPYIIRVKRSLIQRIALVALFSIGILLIIIAIIRLPIYPSGTAQVNRNTLGSVEGLFAAVVANTPTLFTLRRRAASTDILPGSGSGPRTSSRTSNAKAKASAWFGKVTGNGQQWSRVEGVRDGSVAGCSDREKRSCGSTKGSGSTSKGSKTKYSTTFSTTASTLMSGRVSSGILVTSEVEMTHELVDVADRNKRKKQPWETGESDEDLVRTYVEGNAR